MITRCVLSVIQSSLPLDPWAALICWSAKLTVMSAAFVKQRGFTEARRTCWLSTTTYRMMLEPTKKTVITRLY